MTNSKSIKAIMLGTAATASIFISSAALAEVTANASALSNYIFRGTTYSGDSAAVQGGIDWSNDSGIYAGAWTSTLGASGLGGSETDFYAGFAGEAGDVGYDLGVLTYQYTSFPNTNYTEAYVSGSLGAFTVGLNYTVDAGAANKDKAFDQGDIYMFAGADFAAGAVDVSLYAGRYDFTNDGKLGNGDISYNHVGASVSKDGFSFAVDKSDVKEANGAVGSLSDNMNAVRFTVSYGLDFNLM